MSPVTHNLHKKAWTRESFLSGGGSVRWGYCPVGVLSGGGIVRWGYCPVGVLLVGVLSLPPLASPSLQLCMYTKLVMYKLIYPVILLDFMWQHRLSNFRDIYCWFSCWLIWVIHVCVRGCVCMQVYVNTDWCNMFNECFIVMFIECLI